MCHKWHVGKKDRKDRKEMIGKYKELIHKLFAGIFHEGKGLNFSQYLQVIGISLLLVLIGVIIVLIMAGIVFLQ